VAKAIDVYAQEALPADFPLDINDFQTFRTGHPLGGRANTFQVHAKNPRLPRPASSAAKDPP